MFFPSLTVLETLYVEMYVIIVPFGCHYFFTRLPWHKNRRRTEYCNQPCINHNLKLQRSTRKTSLRSVDTAASIMKRVTSRQRLAYCDAFDAAVSDEDSDYETCYETSLSRPSSFVSLPLALEDCAGPPVTIDCDEPPNPRRKRGRGDIQHPAALLRKNVSFSSLVKAVETPDLVPAYDFEIMDRSQQSVFANLMDDVKLHVMSFLTASEARAVSATCHELRQLVFSENAVHLWREWCHRRWPMLEALEKEGRINFRDDFFLPAALGSLDTGLDANLSLLLGMASQSQPTGIDEALFLSARYSLRLTPRLQRWREQVPRERRIQFRTFTQDTIPVVQFTGAVGTGDRCVRSDQPLACPKLVNEPTRKSRTGVQMLENGKHALLDMICGPSKSSSCPWRPFVAPYVTKSATEVHLTPRFVSYFEISIMDRKESQEPPLDIPNRFAESAGDCVAIGVSSGVFHLHSKMPGWDSLSYGYHGDDGGIFHASGDMVRQFGPAYGPGDTVGCGIDYVCGGIFFTLNGEFLGYGWTNVDPEFLQHHDLYPTVGVDTNCPIACNFGERPFAFDLTPLVKSHGRVVESCLSPLKSVEAGLSAPPFSQRSLSHSNMYSVHA